MRIAFISLLLVGLLWAKSDVEALPPGDPVSPMTYMSGLPTSMSGGWAASVAGGVAARATISGGRHGGTNGGFL